MRIPVRWSKTYVKTKLEKNKILSKEELKRKSKRVRKRRKEKCQLFPNSSFFSLQSVNSTNLFLSIKYTVAFVTESV